MAGFGMALSKMGKTGVLGKTPHETDPSRDSTAIGTFNPSLRYGGFYGPSSRYHFPTHSKERPITGPTAGHGIEDEILRRVAQHPSDPFNLKAVGIDNLTWEPDQSDVHDMAYVAWSTSPPVSVYSEIDRQGGFLDRLGLRDGGGQGAAPKPSPAAGQSQQVAPPAEVSQLRDDVTALREQLQKAQDGWSGAAKAREEETAKIRKIIADAKVPGEGGGKFAKALREIQKVVR